MGLLLKMPKGGSIVDVVRITFTAFIGSAALAGGVQNWLFRQCVPFEHVLLIAAGPLLAYPDSTSDWIGPACMAVVVASQRIRAAAPATV